ncbi:LysR substrate-binding domain-containing protein [Mesorhizobium sp. INR15]|uniref:LysR substrate-binding domain-containing protein n=1 Tax=Mesorhizobium sp. INR15 TaxID=2654248 RepID=UPI0018965742|nr:LysR substrate-binding domain-containing protein [Mesorhizobium sp. INR15]QPC93641.1 LysR family transcriptional regulator [Mesorhizobium sp. INR15]
MKNPHANPYRNLPPMAAMAGFEAAARLSSFSLAAQELNMTQSAVSHQVRALEEHLGQPLFMRLNRRVELTDAGRDFHGTVAASLETLRLGVRRLGFYTKPGSVVLAMPPSFASGWYMPRLAQLQADHPDMEPWLVTTVEEIDLTESEVDIMVTHGRGNWDGMVSVTLFTDTVWPMCSPSLRDRMPAAPDARTFLDFPMLHDETEDDWQRWFLAEGMDGGELVNGLNFSDSGVMLDAAARGFGVCLGSVNLASERLARGELVLVGDRGMASTKPFMLVAHPRNLRHPVVIGLWDWLVAEADRDMSK